MPTIKLCVTGLRDADDEARLQRALEAEPGVYGAVANRRDNCAEIDFEDDELAIDRILEIVRESGFGASIGG